MTIVSVQQKTKCLALLLWAGSLSCKGLNLSDVTKAIAPTNVVASTGKINETPPAASGSQGEVSILPQDRQMKQQAQAIPVELPAIPAQMPAQVPAQVPAQMPAQVPAQVPTQVPAQVPTQVPTQVQVEELPWQEPAILIIPPALPTEMLGAILPPTYLDIPNFRDCLATTQKGTASSWCMPANKADACPRDSWEQLLNDPISQQKCP